MLCLQKVPGDGLVQSEVAPGAVDARTCHSATHSLLDLIGARDGSLGRRAFVSNGGTAYYGRKQDCHRVPARRESCFLRGVLPSVVVTRNHHCLNQPSSWAWFRIGCQQVPLRDTTKLDFTGARDSNPARCASVSDCGIKYSDK